jgi:hypothetical protein
MLLPIDQTASHYFNFKNIYSICITQIEMGDYDRETSNRFKHPEAKYLKNLK